MDVKLMMMMMMMMMNMKRNMKSRYEKGSKRGCATILDPRERNDDFLLSLVAL